MGRKGTGVEVRDSSIRLAFTFEGQLHRRTLMVGDKVMPPTAANIKYANRLSADIRDAIRHGRFNMLEFFPTGGAGPAPVTVGKQLDTWLDTLRIEESTKAGYKSAIAFWKAAPANDSLKPLGDVPLRALLTSHVLKAMASRPNISGKTINNYVSVLREAVELAITDKLLAENPVVKVKRAKHQKEPPDPFTRDEAEKIIADMATRHPGQVANMVEFWFWTGLRTGEILGLNWSRVDLASGSVLIAETTVRGVRKDRTKTNTARTVRLNSRALAALQRQRAHTQAIGAEVFQNPRQLAPWGREKMFRQAFWLPTLRRLGIRYRRPYNMRHTYATAMLMAGMTPAFCAKQLGHSVEIFLRTYTKWIDGDSNDREMQRLESSITAPLGQKAKEM